MSANEPKRKRPAKRRPGASDVSEAKVIVDGFLRLVDEGEIEAPTPRDVAIVRRLQGASDTLGALET